MFFSGSYSPINVKVSSLRWNSVLSFSSNTYEKCMVCFTKKQSSSKKGWEKWSRKVKKTQKVIIRLWSQSCSTSLICLIPSDSSWYNFVISISSNFSDLTCWWNNFELLCLKIQLQLHVKEEIYQVWGPEAISHIKCTAEILERVMPVIITKV